MTTITKRTLRSSLTVLAVLGVSVGGSLCLGAGPAYADPVEVKPGLSCDEFAGIITCNNTTNTDYTVIQTRQCLGGTRTTSTPHTQSGPAGTSGLDTTYYTYESQTIDPSVETASIFAAANNTGLGYNGCDYETGSVTYTVQLP